MSTQSPEASLSDQVAEHLHVALNDVVNWAEQVKPEYSNLVNDEAVSLEIVRQPYVDGYWRIQQTTPLILATLKRHNEQQDMSSMRFWSEHLLEEMGHDLIMYKDLIQIYGSEEELAKVLDKQAISAPSAAIIGYFKWQVEYNNPHLLIILRFFLETYFDNIEESQEIDMKNSLGSHSVETLTMHKEEDHEHVKACFDYVDEHFTKADMAEMVWSINLIATCLLESQIMIANRVCLQYS